MLKRVNNLWNTSENIDGSESWEEKKNYETPGGVPEQSLSVTHNLVKIRKAAVNSTKELTGQRKQARAKTRANQWAALFTIGGAMLTWFLINC